MSGTTGKTLTHTHYQQIRFSEVDSMGIVWHGHYIQYLEEAREMFGHHYGIDYLSIAANGFKIPIVDINCKYRRSLKYGDKIRIETTFIDTLAAKIVFRYELYNEITNLLCATGETVQVFLNTKDELQLNYPEFFTEWKIEHGL